MRSARLSKVIATTVLATLALAGCASFGVENTMDASATRDASREELRMHLCITNKTTEGLRYDFNNAARNAKDQQLSPRNGALLVGQQVCAFSPEVWEPGAEVLGVDVFQPNSARPSTLLMANWEMDAWPMGVRSYAFVGQPTTYTTSVLLSESPTDIPINSDSKFFTLTGTTTPKAEPRGWMQEVSIIIEPKI